MNCQFFSISNHVLHRTIERIIKSQNIKLNKKQIKANSKKARKIIMFDISNAFAVAFNKEVGCYYYYVKLKNNGLCLKYVGDNEPKCVITVIKDVDISQELKKYDVKVVDKVLDVVSQENFILCSYIRTIFDDNRFLFVVDNKNKNISLISLEKADGVC